MNLKKSYLPILSFILIGLSGISQKDIITYGIQIKPIIPASYFTGESIQFDSTQTFNNTISNKTGYSFGMVVRRGFTNTIALEYGINYVRRNFNVYLNEGENELDYADFGYVSYEIPVQGLFYAKLSDEMYINGSGGLSLNFFASDVESDGINQLIRHYSLKERYVDLAILSNLGFEYRTKENGYFYIGSSFHLPFNHIANTFVRFDDGKTNHLFEHKIRGSYLTLDFRYFFAETSRVIKKEKKKKN